MKMPLIILGVVFSIFLILGGVLFIFGGSGTQEIIYNTNEQFVSSPEPANLIREIKYENNDLRIAVEETNLDTQVKEEIGRFELKSHSNVNEIKQVPIGDSVVMFYEFNFTKEILNGIGNIEFIDVETGDSLDRDYSLVYLSSEMQDIIEIQCSEIESKGNVTTTCQDVKIGEGEVQVWKPYNSRNIPAGEITIGIKTEVKHGDKIDGIWTINGNRIDRHAAWQASLEVDALRWYRLDETSGTNAIDATGTGNATNTNAMVGVDGIISTAYYFNGVNSRVETDDLIGISGNDNRTISIWYNRNGSSLAFWGMGSSATGRSFDLLANGGSTYYLHGFANDWDTGITIAPEGQWTHAVISKNDTHASLYINGTLMNYTAITFNTNNTAFKIGARQNLAGWFNGTIDEVGIWDRALTSEEIEILYNNGTACTWQLCSVSEGIQVSLTSPSNNSAFISSTKNFIGEIGLPASEINYITNATLNIWYSNNSLFHSNTNTTINGTNSTFTVNFPTVEDISLGTFEWNILAYGINSTGDIINGQADSNFTFTRNAVAVVNETYNFNVYETSYQYFAINLSTIEDILSVNSILSYNGTNYTATSDCNASGFCNIYRNIDIPLVTTGTEQNKSFQWIIDVFDGTTNLPQSITAKQQNVSRIYLKTCDATATNKTLNFTAYGEQTLNRQNPFSFAGTFQSWLGSGSIRRNSSFDNSSLSEMVICKNVNDQAFQTDAIIDYNIPINGSYNTRNYYFENASLTNDTQHINLYLLNNSDSTSFILKLRDNALQPISDALIFTQRYYPGENIFRTVQIAKTDENGQSVGFFETETVDYKFIIVKDGEVLLNTQQQKVVPETAPFTITFTTGSEVANPWDVFEGLANYQSTLEFNETTKIVSYSYIDTSGSLAYGRLLVEKERVNGSNIQICNTNSSQASATIVCNVSDYSGTIIATTFVSRSPEILDKLEKFIISTAKEIFGNGGLIIGWFILLVVVLAFIWNPSAAIIGANAAIIFNNIIGFWTTGYIFIFAILGASIYLLVELNT